MQCYKEYFLTGNTYLVKSTATPPGTTTDCPFVVASRAEFSNLNYVASGTLASDLSAIESDIAALQAGGGGGSSSFVPAFEARTVICLQQNPSTGALEPMSPQPTDKSTCNLIVGSFEESGGSIFALTPQQGAEIGGAIFLVWAIMWGYRMVARALNSSEKETES